MNDGKQTDASLGTIALRAANMGMKIGEMAAASSFVIGARMTLIGAALSNPLNGDYRELGRMVPEKAFAMTHSGIALLEGISAFQRDVTAYWTDLALLATGGLPTPKRLAKLADDATTRGARALLWPVAVGEATMAPMHRTVTSNARRLGQTRQAA